MCPDHDVAPTYNINGEFDYLKNGNPNQKNMFSFIESETQTAKAGEEPGKTINSKACYDKSWFIPEVLKQYHGEFCQPGGPLPGNESFAMSALRAR